MGPRVIRACELAEPPAPWRPEEPADPAAPPRPASEPACAAPDVAGIERDARERGFAEGMRAAEEAYRAKLGRLEALAEEVRQEREGFFDRVEPEVVRLAAAIAEKVIGQELAVRPEVVVEMVRSAMKRLRDRERLRVSVNPRDFEQVRAARDDLIGAVDGVRTLEISEDRRVDPGGCVIESDNGALDARIRTQLGEIERALEEAMPLEASDLTEGIRCDGS